MLLFDHYTQHLSSINLTDHQKMVLAKAVEAGAMNEPSRVALTDDKFITARDVLDDLGLIEYTHETDLIQISDNGITVMKQDNIIDDTDQLTDEGKSYASEKVPTGELTPTPTPEQYTFKEYLNSL